uniref:EXS domain-containing protein n=1 Tax=Palpitomonas bilix TaxID=652834 RepID=A0A7S3D079_9EUKA|mmetsp:Transcript_16841/g.42268  ORF Transcript_16841/g.42268 Transcript_16841/m.42268 type:complete len:576 (+) Transcript_16841:119-1846(+)
MADRSVLPTRSPRWRPSLLFFLLVLCITSFSLFALSINTAAAEFEVAGLDLLRPLFTSPPSRVLLVALSSIGGLAIVSYHPTSKLTSLYRVRTTIQVVFCLVSILYFLVHAVCYQLPVSYSPSQARRSFTSRIEAFSGARGNNGSTVTVSLFNPSLPILLCLIGVLLFATVLKKRELSRLWQLLGEVFLSPFSPVTLSHVLVADFLTSLAKPLRDVASSLCMLLPISPFFESMSMARPSTSVAASSPATSGEVGIGGMDADTHAAYTYACEKADIIFLVALLPFTIRFLQCCRQFAHTRQLTPFINAVKYLSAFPPVLLPLYAGHTHIEVMDLSPLFVANLANTVLSLVWDITMDWGVFSSRSFLLDLSQYQHGGDGESDVDEEKGGRKHGSESRGVDGASKKKSARLPPSLEKSLKKEHCHGFAFLRTSSIFHPLSIVVIVIANAVMRVMWMVKEVYLKKSFSEPFIAILIQVVEIVRRLVWLMLKVEWEAVRTLPLADTDDTVADGKLHTSKVVEADRVGSDDGSPRRSTGGSGDESAMALLLSARKKSMHNRNFIEGVDVLSEQQTGTMRHV